MTERIPQPPEQFLLGNMFAVSATTPVQDLIRLAREYGGIYRLGVRKRVGVIVSDYDLVNEMAVQNRYRLDVWASN